MIDNATGWNKKQEKDAKRIMKKIDKLKKEVDRLFGKGQEKGKPTGKPTRNLINTKPTRKPIIYK